MSYKLLMAAPLLLLMGCPKKNKYGAADDSNPKYHFVKGVDLLNAPDKKTGAIDYAGALELFNRATTLQDNFSNAHYNAAFALEKMGKTTEAVARYRVAVKHKDSLRNLFGLVGLLNETQEQHDGDALLTAKLRKNPGNTKLLSFLVNTLIHLKKYKETISVERAVPIAVSFKVW